MTTLGNIRYVTREIASNWDDTWWWRKRFENRVIGTIQRHRYEDGLNVMAEDWDVLLVLDACRADTFEEVIGTDFDTYRRDKSKASATMEWMQANFKGESYGDTVYVSANPWISTVAPDSFYHIENLWLTKRDLTVNGLEDVSMLSEAGVEKTETINAEETTEAALELAEQYPDKRLIVHYLQPHAPYIGRTDGTLREDVPELEPTDVRENEAKRKQVLEYYRDNLRYVWHHARQVADNVQGKAVVTSDHGELFGDWMWPWPLRGYDHPIGLRTEKLVTVPWAVLDDERRSIVDDGTQRHSIDSAEQKELTEQLRNLGYAEEL